MDGDKEYAMVGETVGLWRLVDGVGRGGMGEVYEAEYDFVHILTLRYAPDQREVLRTELAALPRIEQARLAAEVMGTPLAAEARFAIKICNARTGTAGHKRFLQEAELAARLGDHPYIVSVHAVNGGLDHGPAGRRMELDRGRYRDVAFMVMDLAVRDWDHTRMTIGEAVHVVRCIATALDHAHAKGVVHRDLKPENILGSIEHPLLTDFGIAKEIDQEEGLTRTGQIIGTLDYMSPEQATDAKRVDHRSDIYSLGVVLYEFATSGGLPYSHKLDRDSCLTAIRSDRVSPRWPREHNPGFPVGLERIVLRAMAHRMEDRYQAMSEFITDLDRFTRGEWISPIGRVRLGPWLRFQGRFRPRTVWGAGLLTAAGMFLLIWLFVVPMFDNQRSAAHNTLVNLETMVSDITANRRNGPTRNEYNELVELQKNLPGLGYDDLVDRLAAVEKNLLTTRRLQVAFSRQASPQVLGRMRADLSLLAGLARDLESWPDGDGGLVLDATTSFDFQPIGLGYSYGQLRLQSQNWDSFSLGVRDSSNARSNPLTFTIENGTLFLRFGHRILREERILGSRLEVALEVTPTQIRSWVQGQAQAISHPLPGLRPQGSGQWKLVVPKGGRLVALRLLPNSP